MFEGVATQYQRANGRGCAGLEGPAVSLAAPEEEEGPTCVEGGWPSARTGPNSVN